MYTRPASYVQESAHGIEIEFHHRQSLEGIYHTFSLSAIHLYKNKVLAHSPFTTA